MSATTTAPEDDPPPLTVDVTDVEFGDDAAEDLVAVGCGAIEVLEYLNGFEPNQLAEIGYEQEHVDRLEAAMNTFTDILDRHDVEEFADDVSVIDDDFLDEVGETFPPVAGLFVDELDLPGTQDVDVAECLAIDVGWGGS